MNRTILSKISVLIVAILLFILAITPSISTTNIGEQNTIDFQQDNEPDMLNFAEDDYINCYWKFDTGSGDTAYDSSIHDYHGTIYGASWVTGKSGYALEFDGVNDYVNLDEHEHVGFNKSDDMIFTFYFQTTSNKKGTIFSCSNIYGVYPDIDIWLNASGAIDFHYFVQYCGVTLTTENTFNDGEWHFVKIVYNGVTSNPTVNMYVDNESEGEVTQWICNSAYDFTKIKLGRNSNGTQDYFEGKLDELKIIKFPGGNDQAIPEISGPDEGVQFEEYEFTFVVNDPEEDEIWLYVDWGDGDIEDWIGPYDSGEEITLNHSWDDGGLFEIYAKSKDKWDDGPPAHHFMRIGNQPPDQPIITGPDNGDIEESLEYTFVVNDYESDLIEITIDWGDGEILDWSGPYVAGEEVKFSHSWGEKNKYQIMAKARDELGEGEWSEPFDVIIGNDPPDMPTITGSNTGRLDEELTFKFKSDDIDNDNIWYWIDWGDGETIEDFGPYESGTEIELTHSWDSRDTYIIEAWARDELEAVGEKGTLTLTIPKSKNYFHNFNFLEWLFENFPNLFPILKILF
jgi:hypothetical protein